MPAVARLIIAAEPISLKLIIRNSSPKPSSRFSNSAVDRFERRVARADAGAAGRDDDLRCRIGQPLANGRGDLRGLVLDDGMTRDRVSGAFEQLADRLAAVSFASVRVSLTVSTKQATEMRRLSLVFERTHSRIIPHPQGGVLLFGPAGACSVACDEA